MANTPWRTRKKIFQWVA